MPKGNLAGILSGIGKAVEIGAKTYTKQKKEEEAKKVIDNPESTPVQKALAIETLAEGTGKDYYKTAVAEQQNRQQQKVDSAIYNDLFPTQQQQDVGQRAGVGAVDIADVAPAKIESPVAKASQAIQGQQQQFPGYKNFQEAPPQQYPEQQEPQAMPNQQQEQAQEPGTQMQGQLQGGQQKGIQNVPTETLLQHLARTKDPGIKSAIQSELKSRDVASKNEATKEAAKISAAQKDRTWSAQTNSAYKTRMDGLKASTPVRSRAVDYAKQAVSSGDVGRMSINHLADVLNMPSLKNSQGALLDQAIKTNLIGTLSEVTAKATNIFLERVALDAFARAGQTPAANLMKLEALDTELKLNALEIETYDNIRRNDIEQFGSEQPYLDLRVSDALKPLQADIINGASWKMKKIQESEKSYQQLYDSAFEAVPQGTPLTNKMANVILDKVKGDKRKAAAVAERLGYTAYSKEQKARYDK